MDRKQWDKVYRQLPKIPALKISEPPCRHCRHWRPEPNIKVHKGAQVVQGIVLCQAENMHRDFSCYDERENASGKTD